MPYNVFSAELRQRIKEGKEVLKMANNEVNTVVLSKTSYDNMRGTNDRASMLLREIMDSMSIADDSNDLSLDCDRIIKTIEVLYPDTFKKKVGYMKHVRTKKLGQI